MDNEELKVLLEKKPINSFTEKKPKNIFKRLSTFFDNNQVEECKVEPNINNSKFESINQHKILVEDLTYNKKEKNDLKVKNSDDLFDQNKNNDHDLTSKLLNIIENKDEFLNKKKNMKVFSCQNTWNNINQKLINTINEY